MSTNFPTTLDNTTGQKVVDGTNIIVAALPNNLLDMIEALQAKVGVDESSVNTSLDFLLRKGYVKVVNLQASGSAGGGISADTWTTVPLTSEVSDNGALCSLSSNQITLAAGTYRCSIKVPGYNCGWFRSRLYNVTGSTELIHGSNASCATTISITGWSFIVGEFAVAAGQALEVQMYASSTRASDGMGQEFGSGDQVYCIAEFWRISNVTS